jgi:hypothetical protein
MTLHFEAFLEPLPAEEFCGFSSLFANENTIGA